MYCPKCGKPNADASQFCASCGQALASPTVASTQPVVGTVIPASTAPETSGKAVASLICGCLSFIFPAAIAAIILGHISRSEIRKSGGRLSGSGLALAGLVFGYIGVSFVPIVIIAAIAIPNLLRARIAANEASAVQVIRTINVAEVAYANNHPDIRYTCSLGDLKSAGLPGEMATGERYGYEFHLDGCSPQGYVVLAVPHAINQTGVRAFCSGQDAAIRYDPAGSGSECAEHGAPLP
jgi:type IV pilus assembly protein PilA